MGMMTNDFNRSYERPCDRDPMLNMVVICKCLVVVSKCLLVISKCLVVVSKCLVVISKFLVVVSKCLVVVSKCLVVVCNFNYPLPLLDDRVRVFPASPYNLVRPQQSIPRATLPHGHTTLPLRYNTMGAWTLDLLFNKTCGKKTLVILLFLSEFKFVIISYNLVNLWNKIILAKSAAAVRCLPCLSQPLYNPPLLSHFPVFPGW